jgi:hypothetical protein
MASKHRKARKEEPPSGGKGVVEVLGIVSVASQILIPCETTQLHSFLKISDIKSETRWS